MSLNFEPINLKMQDEYLRRFSASPQKTSDYSFVNLFGWSEEYGLRWAWSDRLVWIKQTIPEDCLWAPVGQWESVDWGKCLDDFVSAETRFVRIPENLLQLWESKLEDSIISEESRGHWDYLYSVEELIELKGNRFHKKKNLINQFLKKYDYTYIPLGMEAIELAKGMQEDWCTWRDCESSEALTAENRVISKTLDSWEKLKGISGGAIMVDEKMAAYTIAERLSKNMLVIHFEKGDPGYKGVYQAINQMFLEHAGKNFKTVNREQDLDDEGLRKAKLSYQPVDFLKKYSVILR